MGQKKGRAGGFKAPAGAFQVETDPAASSAALVEAPAGIRRFPWGCSQPKTGSFSFTGQPGRSKGQSEHAGGFRDTATPQIGLEAVTSVLAGWEPLSESGQLGRSTGGI
jgi:hypothetical protein